MAFEDLHLADASADAVTSRLGLLVFGDRTRGPQELARVLKTGARFSLALWSDLDDNPYMGFGLKTLGHVLPSEEVPDLSAAIAPLSDRATVEGWLTDAGLSTVDSDLFSWKIAVPDFETWWNYNTAAGSLNPLFDGLEDEERQSARDHMSRLLNEFQTTGGYELNSRCRLVFGSR